MLVLAHVVAFILAAAIQRAWPQPLRVDGVVPDLVLVLVAFVGITRGPVAGYAAGLLGGFLSAASGDGPFGAIVVSHLAVGFIAGQAKGRVFVDHVLAAPVIALLATLLAAFVQLILSPPPEFVPWLKEVGLAVLYTGLISPLTYVYTHAVHHRWPARAET